MKNKFLKMFSCFLLCITFIFSGCSLIERDNAKYMGQSVATVTVGGGKDAKVYEITTKQFINAYNSYGDTLSQQGYDFEEAKQQTVDVLVDRVVLLDEAKSKVTLSDDDKKEILDEVYTSLKENFKSLVETVEKEFDSKLNILETEEEEKVVYTAFAPTATIVEDRSSEDGYKIKLLNITDTKQNTNFENLQAVEDAFMFYVNSAKGEDEKKVYSEAFKRYLNNLKANEKGLNLSTDFASILTRHTQELKTSHEDSLYLSLYQEMFMKEEIYSSISVQQVFDKYASMMLESNFKYGNNAETNDKEMLESFAEVNYYVDTTYFYVSHILVQFDDAQKAEYEGLKAKKDSGEISYQVYTQKLNNLANNLNVQVRDEDGLVTDTKLKASTLQSNLENSLSYAKTKEEKAQLFNDAIYKYNQDPGVQNAEYMYVIGQETSQMVESFTDAARELDENGEFGAVSKLVLSEHGAHILFYGGRVQNAFTITAQQNFEIEVNQENVEKLTTTKLSVLNNKTIFDKVFETFEEVDQYAVFESMNLDKLKANCTITLHKNVIKNI